MHLLNKLSSKFALTVVGSLVLGVVGWHATKFVLQATKNQVRSVETETNNSAAEEEELVMLDVGEVVEDTSEAEVQSVDYKVLFKHL